MGAELDSEFKKKTPIIKIGTSLFGHTMLAIPWLILMSKALLLLWKHSPFPHDPQHLLRGSKVEG